MLAATLSAAACGIGGDDESADDDGPGDRDEQRDEEERGTLSYDETIEVFIADLQDYWAGTMPEIYDESYDAIPDDNLVAYSEDDPTLECGGFEIPYDDLEGNAFYCDPDDLIVWDDDQLFPELYERYGGFVIGLTLSHEWAHAIQARVGVLEADIVQEQQADCFAGAWVQHIEAGESDDVDLEQLGSLDFALSGFLRYRDPPGVDPDQPGAHGSAFDRVGAFQEGFEQGEERCADYTVDPPPVVPLPFTSQADFEQGGDLPYDDIFDFIADDLDAYWSETVEEYESVDEFVPYDADDESELPECGSENVDPADYEETVFYCPDDDFIAWDDEFLQGLYDDTGDFGVALLLANAYSTAVQEHAGVDGDRSERGLQTDCLSGSWAGSVPPAGDREDAEIVLSPGDLDEVVQALLVEGGAEPSETETNDDDIFGVSGSQAGARSARGGDGVTAFERVQAFRTGFFEGQEQCLDLTGD